MLWIVKTIKAEKAVYIRQYGNAQIGVNRYESYVMQKKAERNKRKPITEEKYKMYGSVSHRLNFL